MSRIEAQSLFLSTLARSPVKDLKTIITNCSEDQLKAIVDCILHFNKLSLSKEEKKCYSHYKLILKSFKRLGWKSLTLSKKRILKHRKLIRLIISCTVLKLTEFALNNILSSS
jgi:hypothetical protein